MELTTPALLFPAISLLLLAYTSRFLVLAPLIRQLLLVGSLLTSLSEIAISTRVIEAELADINAQCRRSNG